IQEELPRYRRWADPRLHALADHDTTPPGRRLRASLALADVDLGQVDYLSGRLPDSAPEEVLVVRGAPAKAADLGTPALWAVLHDPDQAADERCHAGLALAEYAFDSEAWTDADAEFLTDQLLKSKRDLQRGLRDALRPVAGRLLEPLQRVFGDAR